MANVDVPARDAVSPTNQSIFDRLEGSLGKVPNLYATFAHSRHALGTYLALQSAPSSIQGKSREVINLVVSEVNACAYCLAAHTLLGGMVGFSPEQILLIRAGHAPFDRRLDALARLTRDIVERRGHAEAALVDAFLASGWTTENLVDAIMVIGDKTVTNYLHGATRVPVDFPAAPPLERRGGGLA